MYLITGENVYNIFCIERRKHNAMDMALKESNLDYTDNTEGVVFTLREWVTWDWFKVYITVEFYLYFISLWK